VRKQQILFEVLPSRGCLQQFPLELGRPLLVPHLGSGFAVRVARERLLSLQSAPSPGDSTVIARRAKAALHTPPLKPAIMPPVALGGGTHGGGLKEVHGQVLPLATLKMSDLPLCQSE
jgi:hypothetical protein